MKSTIYVYLLAIIFWLPMNACQKKTETGYVFGDIIGLGVKFGQGQPLSDLPILTDLNVRWVRDDEGWSAIEKKPGEYAFSENFRKRLDFYRENNIGIIFCLCYDNPVAYPPTPEDHYRSVNPEAFGRYAVASARLLKESGVRFVLEVWDEPHNFVLGKMFGDPWHGKPPCPWLDHYIKMLNAAVKEVKAFDPSIKILSDDDCTIIHYRYLEAGLPRALDGFAFHPYMRGKNSTPEVAQEGYGADYEVPFTLTDEDHSFRSMVRRLREQGEAKIGKTPELWVTEFGCPVNEDVTENVTFSLGKATEEELTGILVRAFVGAEAAGIKTFCWFSSWDGPDGPMGLITNDGRKRKTYYAFKTMSEQLGECRLIRQIAGSEHLTTGLQAYLFRNGNDLKVVAWVIDGPTRELPLHGALKNAQVADVMGSKVGSMKDISGMPYIELGISPLYISGIHNEKQIQSYFKTVSPKPETSVSQFQKNGIVASRASDFLNSIGINTHVAQGENVGLTINALNYGGFHNFRDGGRMDPAFVDKVINIHDNTVNKVKFVVCQAGPDDAWIEAALSGGRRLANAGALLAMEGPNEPNNWPVTYQGVSSDKNTDFLPVAKFQQDYYVRIKADSLLKDYPVFASSDGGGASPNNVGLQYLVIPSPLPDGVLMPAGTMYADYANVHNYFCHPSVGKVIDNLVWHAADPVLDKVPGSGGSFDGIYNNYGKTWLKGFLGYRVEDLETLPRVTTETGIPSGDWDLTEEKRGPFYLDLYLAQFKRGYKYTFIYNMFDSHLYPYGMFYSNGTPKPAATYLHNLTTILADSGSIASPRVLNYSIPCQPATVHDLLLQKSNGKFYLVLWGEKYSGGSNNVIINLGSTCSSVKIYDPTVGSSAIQNLNNVNLTTLSIIDHPLIVEI